MADKSVEDLLREGKLTSPGAVQLGPGSTRAARV